MRLAYAKWQSGEIPQSAIPPQISSRPALLQTLLTQLTSPGGGSIASAPLRVRTVAWRTGSYVFDVGHGDGSWYRWTFDTARDEIATIRYGPPDGEERTVSVSGGQ